ncbi:hypothetical protein F5050DRAFT_430223 [Lentinula boryana]|uniref:Uncharacterized protein n=1 Tax=Lentinula boryana TaxID=40481 RepID=A0ABQ8Q850_9AGAR|nr:hypothetical protein F5050DRAFT_430223 [Lentinula boryana]
MLYNPIIHNRIQSTHVSTQGHNRVHNHIRSNNRTPDQKSGSQPKSVKQSVSPSRKEAPLWGEALSPVIHFDLPPMWQERWSLLFSMPNGWCKALLSVKGTRSIEPCPTNPQGRKIIASLPKFSDPQARRVFMMDLLSEPASAVDVASSVNEACAGDVEYFNNVVKGPLKDRIGKVPEEWKGIYEPMHEVMIHGNGLWHGPNGAGWAYYNPTRSAADV